MERNAHARVPVGFREEVRTALKGGAAGDLRLLAFEAASFDWQPAGLRLIGSAQAQLLRSSAPLGGVPDEPPSRVVLFTGHMVDAADRPVAKARFPRTAQAEARAHAMIKGAVERELEGHAASFLGIAGAACGGDILFHEVCAELAATTHVYLLMPPEPFEQASVQPGGAGWVDRYRALLSRSTPRVLQPSAQLPDWLADKPDYNAWERNNLWMMFNALATQARDLVLVALFNGGREAGGPGGTGHLVAEAATWGFRPVELDARELLTASCTGADEA